MPKLYDSRMSGNAWKVRLALRHLGIPFERVTVDLAKGEARTPDFLARNPNGKVPVLELDDGRSIFESGAILLYLAEGTPLLPSDRLDRARVYQWLLWEQAEAVRNLAGPRFWIALRGMRQEKASEIADWHEAGYRALGIMDDHLIARDYFVGSGPTAADLALFPYASLAPEGDYDLSRFPNLLAWIERMRHLQGYEPLVPA
jgi:glutathione S-transferase